MNPLDLLTEAEIAAALREWRKGIGGNQAFKALLMEAIIRLERREDLT
jgi:hypothetical protein